MLKQSLLSLALMGSCSVAMADNYTYVAGGLQFGSINSNSRFDQQFDRQIIAILAIKIWVGFILTAVIALITRSSLMADLAALPMITVVVQMPFLD